MRKLIYLLLATALFGVSCNPFKNLEVAPYEGEFAIPVLQTEVSLQKMMEKFDAQYFLKIDPDGSMALNYKGSTTQRSSLDFFADLQGFGFPILDTVSALPLAFEGGVKLDYAILKNGKFRYAVFNDYPGESLTMDYWIPEFTKDGEMFKTTLNIPPAFFPSLPALLDSIELGAGYRIEPNLADSIFVHYKCKRENGEYITLDTGKFYIQMLDFAASYAQGYLGSELYDVPLDTIELDFFNTWELGEVHLENPLITITADNSFGFPVRSMAHLVNIKGADGVWTPLQSSFINAGIDFAYPSLSEVGQTKTTVFNFSKDNSNIVELVAQNPTAVEYDIDATTNPDQNTNLIGYLTDSSFFRVGVEVNLPLWGTAKDYSTVDTVDFSTDIPDNVASAELKIVTENGLPMSVISQIYMATKNGQILDSLFTGETLLLDGAPVDNDGYVTGETTKETFIEISEEKLAAMRQAKKFLVKAGFSTTNNGSIPVRASANQKAALRIGMRFKLKN